MKRPAFIIAALVVCVAGFLVWWHYRLPEGIEPMDGGGERMALVGFWTGIVALLTAMVGLLTRILEMAKAGR